MRLGYEPQRIADLTRQCRWALGAIDGIRSGDPAAAEAMGALARLRAVVTDGLLATSTHVEVTDPLGRSGPRLLAFADFEYTPWDAMSTAPDPPSEPTRFADWSDDELFDVMAEQRDRFDQSDILDRLDDPFWVDELPEVAEEFRRRAHADSSFAQRMVDEVASNPMLGLIVGQGGFSDDVLAQTAIATAIEHGVTAADAEVRSAAMDALLAELSGRIDVAVTVFADPDAFEQLLVWNEYESTSRPIDQTLLESVLTDVLERPFDDVSSLDDVHQVIANVVDLADHEYFDTGFPPGLALTISEGLTPYLPYVIGSLDTNAGVLIKNFDDERGISIGTLAEFTDLVGNLLRDPVTRGQVVAGVTALTVASDQSLFDLDDVAGYVRVLGDAADNEQIEEEIEAARTQGRWNASIGGVVWLVDKGLSALGPKGEAARAQLDIVEEGARWLVEQIEADQLGLDAIDLGLEVMLIIGFAVVFLQNFEPGDDDEAAVADAAQSDLDEIRQAIRDGRAGVDEVYAAVLDLEEDLGDLPRDSVDRAIADRYRNRDFDVVSDAGLRDDGFAPGEDTELTD